MLHQAIKVRIYPKPEQETLLAQHFGCARWWWNYALNKSIETYKKTGFGLSQSDLNALLPKLKKAKETAWLSSYYSQVFQATTLNLKTAYIGKLVEIDRWFPSSKLCSHCDYQVDELPLNIREWTCSHCGADRERDGNAATNIRAEGIRLIKADGSAVSANGGEVRPKGRRKSVLRHSPVNLEAYTILASS